MPTVITISLIVCAIGVALTLYADHLRNKSLEWLGKPLAALAFIAAGISWGALDSLYGQWVLAGLIFGALGDVLLIPAGTGRVFLGGMIAFALGHFFYVIGFAQLPLSTAGLVWGAAGMGIFSVGILRWLMPNVPADFKGPVAAYIVIIGLMVITAVGATVAGANPLILVGAVGFALSDLAVARHRFVAPGNINRLWGLPLYFASQMVIAATVA